jgi:integrase
VPQREPVPLSEEEVEAVVGAIERPEYRVLIYVLAYGGLRWGEACALRTRDLWFIRVTESVKSPIRSGTV